MTAFDLPGYLRKAIIDSIVESVKKKWEEFSDEEYIDENYSEYLEHEDREVGEALSTDPLILIKCIEEPNKHRMTLLFRGGLEEKKVLFNKYGGSVFLHLEIVIMTDTPGIAEWNTILFDTKLSKANTFDAKLGGGYDKRGFVVGKGGFAWIPTGLAIEVFLGGLSEDGIMLGFDLNLPTAIPLGNSGVGLKGFRGEFAWNFVPNLEFYYGDETSANALVYARWAEAFIPDENIIENIDTWIPGKPSETSIGLGSGADIVDIMSNGNVIAIAPAWLMAMIPGPVIISGGKFVLLNTNYFEAEAYLVIARVNGRWSIAISNAVEVKVPRDNDDIRFLEAKGNIDAFFDFSDTSAWFLNIGTKKKPIKGTLLKGMVDSYFIPGSIVAKIYFQINSDRVTIGADALLEAKKDWKAFGFRIAAGMGFDARLGWDPWSIGCIFKLPSELSVWAIKKFIKFGLSLKISAEGHLPDPKHLIFLAEFKLNMPWPIDDIKKEFEIVIGDDTGSGRPIVKPIGNKASAMHIKSGLKWPLDAGSIAEIWSDSNLVIPFSRRAYDNTGQVIGDQQGSTTQGGYEIKDTITKIELKNLDTGQIIPAFGIWSESPGGSTSQLHLLGTDPYSQLSPYEEELVEMPALYPDVMFQGFGEGPDGQFNTEQRFGEVLINPHGITSTLHNMFGYFHRTRVLSSQKLDIHFEDIFGTTLPSQDIDLYIIESVSERVNFTISVANRRDPDTRLALNYSVQSSIQLLSSSLVMKVYRINVDILRSRGESERISQFRIESSNQVFCLFGIKYTPTRPPKDDYLKRWGNYTRTILVPANYEINVGGKSEGIAMIPMIANKPEIYWDYTGRFKVTSPSTIRPYIKYATVGDIRNFSNSKSEWNPTMPGLGFPAYNRYGIRIRFNVPYMSQLFESGLVLRVDYLHTEEHWQTGPPLLRHNAENETSMSENSIQFINQYNGSLSPDEEITVFPDLTPGEIQLQVLHQIQEGGQPKMVLLDSWNCIVSRFESFTDHLNSISHPITISHAYSSSGHVPVVLCPLDLGTYPSSGDFPDELTSPQADWILDTSLSQCLTGLNEKTTSNYLHFIMQTQVVTYGVVPPLLVLPENTELQAIVDDQSRILALWVRTPEPIDWRRVNASLTVYPCDFEGTCPSGFANRSPLHLGVSILPSPDATSAFLVGKFETTLVKLPRGYFKLTFEFHSVVEDLPPLVPPTHIGPVETVEWVFVQHLGEDWPTPSNIFVVPGWVLEKMFEIYEIDPRVLGIIEEIFDPANPDPIGPLIQLEALAYERLHIRPIRDYLEKQINERLRSTGLSLWRHERHQPPEVVQKKKMRFTSQKIAVPRVREKAMPETIPEKKEKPEEPKEPRFVHRGGKYNE